MASKQPCKCKAKECEECPEWIFTFADLVMLMMGFFVILWVLKPNPGKAGSAEANDEWVKVAAAIREAFDYLPDPHSKDPVDVQMLLNKLQKMPPLKSPGAGGKTPVPTDGATGVDQEVTSIRDGKQAVVGGRLIFAAGDPKLSPAAIATLNQIAEKIKGHRNIVMVKGHTSLDDLPENAAAQQKMDLSLRRAQAAADYLIARGVELEVLRVQGCSTFEPLVRQVYTPDAQSDNRRVEIQASNTLVDEMK